MVDGSGEVVSEGTVISELVAIAAFIKVRAAGAVLTKLVTLSFVAWNRCASIFEKIGRYMSCEFRAKRLFENAGRYFVFSAFGLSPDRRLIRTLGTDHG